MHLHHAGFILFALFVPIYCLKQRSEMNTDCLFEESTESTTEHDNDIPVLSYLLRAFNGPPEKINAQNCTNHRLRMIESRISDLRIQFSALEADILLRSSLAEARKTFNSVFFVYEKMKVFSKFNGSSERKAVKRECVQNSPSNALIDMARQGGYSTKLFQSIVNGSRFSEDIFNKSVSVIINEAAICAILAQECDKFLHRDSYNGPAQEMRNQQIHGYLKAIEEEIIAARQMLLGQFGTIVVDIIHEALDYIDSTGIGRREGVKHVYQVLSERFTSLAWAVTIYKSVHQQAMHVHAHESMMDNWFNVDNGHHTVIVHYADKRSNCTFPAASLLRNGITVLQIIGDRDNYNTFVKQADKDFGQGIPLLKNALKQLNGGLLPDNLFISITKYHQSFSIAREYEYHFFEQVVDEDNGRVVKTALIGWC